MVLVLPYNDPPFYIRFLKSQLPINCTLAVFRYYHPEVINLVGGRYMLQLILSHFLISVRLVGEWLVNYLLIALCW